MTLVAALRGSDGLVLAADSRGTIGDPRGLTAINDSLCKLYRLTDQTGIVIAGAADLAVQLITELQATFAAHPETRFIDEVMVETRRICRERWADWLGSVTPENRPGIVFILAGFTAPPAQAAKIYQLASLYDFAPQLSASGMSLAGVPQYANYLLHRMYHPDMQCAHLERLSAYIISETATQDPKVGGPIRIATVTHDRGFEEVDQAAIRVLMKDNERQTAKLRNFFFGR